MARPNIQYLDLPMFVPLCPQCASRMTIRSIAALQQAPTCDAIAYECVECKKDTTRTVDRESVLSGDLGPNGVLIASYTATSPNP
jgi:hypothetical protein